MTRRLWWRISQAGTQVTIITKFQIIVRPANRLKIYILEGGNNNFSASVIFHNLAKWFGSENWERIKHFYQISNQIYN